MDTISNDAQDLLITLKRINKIKTLAGEYVDKRRVLVEYGFSQNSKELNHVFLELKEAGYIKKESGAYRLLAKASNWQPSTGLEKNVTIYSGVQNSNIAHLSPNATQTLDIKSVDEEIKAKLDLLVEAVNKKDSSRAQAIFDGLLVAAPSLALQILQIGLGSRG